MSTAPAAATDSSAMVGMTGEVYRLEPDPAQFDGLNVKLGVNDWSYHDVLYDAENDEVYDPMTYGHSDPVPFGTWARNFPHWGAYRWGPLR
jgi:hypothetical protein